MPLNFLIFVCFVYTYHKRALYNVTLSAQALSNITCYLITFVHLMPFYFVQNKFVLCVHITKEPYNTKEPYSMRLGGIRKWVDIYLVTTCCMYFPVFCAYISQSNLCRFTPLSLFWDPFNASYLSWRCNLISLVIVFCCGSAPVRFVCGVYAFYGYLFLNAPYLSLYDFFLTAVCLLDSWAGG